MALRYLADCPAPVCRPDQSVADAVRLLVANTNTAVMVMDEGEVKGIFCERDVLTRVVAEGLDAEKTRIDEVMSVEVKTIYHEAPLEDALTMMREFQFRHIPLTGDDGQIVGIMSMRRVYDAYCQQLAADLTSMTNYFGADGPGGD